MRRTPSRRATITDVAAAAGVSPQTVSNVLNSPQLVRPATRERVRTQIDLLGYRPSSAARGLRNQRAGAVGVELMGCGRGSDVAPLLLRSLAARATEHQVHLVPFVESQGGSALEGYREMTRRRLVDAFVFADTSSGDPRPTWLVEHGIPFATFGRVYGHPELTCWADVDGHGGLTLAVEHLVDKGYGTVGYLGWPLHLEDPAVSEDRHGGWVDATTRLGVRGPSAVAVQDLASAVAAADDLLDQLGPGDAVACASDLLALGVVYAASRRGLIVGPDLGVVGFDGSLVADRHGITTVVQPWTDLADHLLRTVHDQLAGGDMPTGGFLLEPTLAPGPSTDRDAPAAAYAPLPIQTRR